MAYTKGKEFEYTVKKKITILGVNSKYENALSIVAWNGFSGKFDLRRWRIDDEGKRIPTKGISLTPEEMENLKKSLNGIDDFEKYLDQNG